MSAVAPRLRVTVPEPLRPGLRVVGAAVGALVASALVAGLAYLMRLTVDLGVDNYRALVAVGVNAPKALAVTALAIVLLLAFPLALSDGYSSARFRRAERELREARPDAAVSPYEGPEGRGLAFDSAEGRTLLLRPVGGLGPPRTLVVPLPDPASASGESAPTATGA